MNGTSGVRLGRLAGIDIIMDWSLLIIFLLIASSLALGVFPAWHPDWSTGLSWLTAVAAAVLFLASILAHEFSHAIVGRANGIEVRRVVLFIFGGMAQMENEPPNWKAEFLMAIVGPVTSLVLGIGFLFLGSLLAGPVNVDPGNPQAAFAGLGPLATLMMWLGPVNILLAVFNMVPGFPLDGGRVLRALMWKITGSHTRATRWASASGRGFAWLLMGCGFAMILGIEVPFFGSGVVGGLWLALIGWFLNNAALQNVRQLMTRESLTIPVERLMQRHAVPADPGMSVGSLIDERVMSSGQRSFPVIRDNRLLGMISLSDLSRGERGARLEAVMTPRARLITTSPDEDAYNALAKMGRHNVNQLPVLDGERLVGLIHREDVLKWMFLHGDGNRRAEGAGPP